MTEKNNLKKAVEGLHNCKAKLRDKVHLIEEFKKQKVWDGLVYVFDIQYHPKATVCYAWSSPIEGSNKRKFYAVLGVPPVNSAQDAVRAAIVSDFKSKS